MTSPRSRERRPMYGGGMGELGVGRGQVQLLASLFHADAANDVEPSADNEDDPADGLPANPLAPRPEATGFRCFISVTYRFIELSSDI